VLAKELHDTTNVNPPLQTGPLGSVLLGQDGSMAALVPARRALSWQLTNPSGEAIVRERYWLNFQPGEIRSCTSCHGLNTASQTSGGAPTNVPQAFVDLLNHWETLPEQTLGLGNLAAGTVGATSGGPFDVLKVNGSVGGASRTITLGVGSPFLINMATPPHLSSSQPFGLFGMIGLPSPAFSIQSALGTHLFPPQFARPSIPGLFTLSNGLISDPYAVLPPSFTPWSIAAILPTPMSVTLQGIMLDPSAPPHSLSITNGIAIRVQ
jgi:hypothetical protein